MGIWGRQRHGFRVGGLEMDYGDLAASQLNCEDSEDTHIVTAIDSGLWYRL